MPKILPLTPSLPNYQAGLSVGTTQYLINVRWNGREEKFYMDVLDQDGNAIRSGMALVLGTFIGRQEASADFPPGAFVLVDTSNEGRDPGIDDLGARVQVYHFDEDELEELVG